MCLLINKHVDFKNMYFSNNVQINMIRSPFQFTSVCPYVRFRWKRDFLGCWWKFYFYLCSDSPHIWAYIVQVSCPSFCTMYTLKYYLCTFQNDIVYTFKYYMFWSLDFCQCLFVRLIWWALLVFETLLLISQNIYIYFIKNLTMI